MYLIMFLAGMVDDGIVISILMPPIYASLLNNFRSALKSGMPRYSQVRRAITLRSGVQPFN